MYLQALNPNLKNLSQEQITKMAKESIMREKIKTNEILKYFKLELSIEWLIFTLLVSSVSQLGDITISYFKRLSKIKDTGKIIPGHGGLLDRVDGMIFAFPTSYLILKIFFIMLPLLFFVALLTYLERKIIAAMQLRRGPNVVGPLGLLQPLADGLKLLLKEIIIPTGSNKIVFLLAPIITFVLSLIGWAVIPFDYGVVLSNINVGILYLFAISSLDNLRFYRELVPKKIANNLRSF